MFPLGSNCKLAGGDTESVLALLQAGAQVGRPTPWFRMFSRDPKSLKVSSTSTNPEPNPQPGLSRPLHLSSLKRRPGSPGERGAWHCGATVAFPLQHLLSDEMHGFPTGRISEQTSLTGCETSQTGGQERWRWLYSSDPCFSRRARGSLSEDRT